MTPTSHPPPRKKTTPQTDPTPYRCPKCGGYYATFKNMRVHMVAHQFRDCVWCGSSFAANGISNHEARCKHRDSPVDDDCEVIPLRAMLAPDGWFERACRFLETAPEIPCSPRVAMVVFPDRDPVFAPFTSLTQVLRSLGPNGAVVIPTTALDQGAT